MFLKDEAVKQQIQRKIRKNRIKNVEQSKPPSVTTKIHTICASISLIAFY